MSAIEVINEVRELPLEEQEQVLNFLQDKLRPHKLTEDEVKHAVDADFKKAADKVFRENDNLFRRLAQ
jgi:transcriptional regulator with AAA-type ATPase domain